MQIIGSVVTSFNLCNHFLKVALAEACGAKGVVLFNDPEDYGPVSNDELFPKTWWMPRDGVQRGSLKDTKGDPLTLGYPAKGKFELVGFYY